MLKQINVKSVKPNEGLLQKMYEESQKYLDAIGFTKTALLSVTDQDTTFRGFIFTSGKEKIIVEYKKDLYEEAFKVIFSPLDIKFVYDILLMRFNQIAMDEKESVYIYSN
jgi:hypothetical protein